MHQLKPYLHNKKHIIWDWNGTLLDDVQVAVNSVSKILAAEGLPTIAVNHYRSVFGFPIRAYYERIGLTMDDARYDQLNVDFHRNYNESLHDCKLYDGVEEFLREASAMNISHSILSAAQQDWLLGLLDHYNIKHHFKNVYGLVDYMAASKIDRGRQLIADAGIDRASTLLVGDTDHDVEVGRELGIDVVIFGDGHQAAERFADMGVQVLERRYFGDEHGSKVDGVEA